MNCKTIDKVFFSGKEEYFVYFSEHFEARMYALKLNKTLDGTVGYMELIPTLMDNPHRSKLTKPIERERRFLAKNRWPFGMHLERVV